ncbi:hypothetical protein [Streptosporangium carneum]|uniref:Uncharacterized protein n=1 Tax=Streptosporangium carneum TaxID=47481 RepID=A0A9W6HWI5_9ACTN|nr:hypothetical protein [Streptosporangium carneum]GLK06679.1 hypothetical protein GCM10017600_00840 [Streptosporangium carneum]
MNTITPRWATWTAHAAAVAPLPAGLWRIAMAIGLPVGFDQAWLERADIPGRGSVWPIVLSLVTEGCALLALGLVRPWGERAPRWLPFIGGRTVHPYAAIVPATLASVLLTVFGLVFGVKIALVLAGADSDPNFPEGVSAVVMSVAYIPMLAWGPLLALTTLAYGRRRAAGAGSASVGRPAERNLPAHLERAEDRRLVSRAHR